MKADSDVRFFLCPYATRRLFSGWRSASFQAYTPACRNKTCPPFAQRKVSAPIPAASCFLFSPPCSLYRSRASRPDIPAFGLSPSSLQAANRLLPYLQKTTSETHSPPTFGKKPGACGPEQSGKIKKTATGFAVRAVQNPVCAACTLYF